MLGKKLGRPLPLWENKWQEEEFKRVRITRSFQNQNVESILIQIAKACGSMSFAVSPGLEDHKDGTMSRVPGTEEVCF